MSPATAASTRRSCPTDGGRLLGLFLLLSLPACQAGPRPVVAPVPPPPAPLVRLQRDIDAILSTPALARSSWGVVVASPLRDETLIRLNGGRLLMPGSVMKVMTLAAAAERLGWDFTYETRLLATGAIDRDTGVLDGDLIAVGSGDPSIGTDPLFTLDPFPAWSAALAAAGIRAVAGRIIGDDNAFDDEELGPGWAWDDVAGRDAAGVSGLQYAENSVLATIAPAGDPGGPAVVSFASPAAGLLVANHVVTTPPDTAASLLARRAAGGKTLELRGSVPLGSAPLLRLFSAPNPTHYFAASLRDALVTRGIAVAGDVVDADDLPVPLSLEGATTVATHRSQPLAVLARRLMKDSRNVYGEALLKTLGRLEGPASFESGRTVAAETLAELDVDPAGLVQVDGSGLSRYNYVTADNVMTVLAHVAREPRLYQPFAAALAVAGQDGTVAARMIGTAAAGNARVKSGTLANVRSLAGYVTSGDGELLAFVLIANNFGAEPGPAVAAIDAIVVTLAGFRR